MEEKDGGERREDREMDEIDEGERWGTAGWRS